MAFNPSPKVKVARDYAQEFDFEKVIIIGINETDRKIHSATYGADKQKCDEAEQQGNTAYKAILAGYKEDGDSSDQYLIWSPHWTKEKPRGTHVFYMPDSNGYTDNIDKAGRYSRPQVDSMTQGILREPEDVEKAWDSGFYNEAYAIKENNLEILGKKITAIRR